MRFVVMSWRRAQVQAITPLIDVLDAALNTYLLKAPGISPGRHVNVHREFFQFDGSLQLHIAMPIEHGGKRFTLIWYSVATRWLKKLSDSDPEKLTQYSFQPWRPREAEHNSHSFCVAGSYLNASRSYEDDFLSWARPARPDIDAKLKAKGVPLREATVRLKQQWAAIP